MLTDLSDRFFEDIPAATTRSGVFSRRTEIIPADGFLSIAVIGEAATTVFFTVTVDNAAVISGMRSTTGTTFATGAQFQLLNTPVRRGQIVIVDIENRDGANAQQAWASYRLGRVPMQT